MRVRVTKVDEYQFLSCLKLSLWGSKSARFKDWKEGDYLVFSVNKALAGYAKVSGKPFSSNEVVWDDGLFPNRIPIKFCQVLSKGDRIPILGEVREAFVSEWGNTYGWGILNQQLLSDQAAEKIINLLETYPNVLSHVELNIEQLLREADEQRKSDYSTQKVEPASQVSVEQSPLEKSAPEEESRHTIAQNALIELGRITGCSVCVAVNDRNRSINGGTLGDKCLKQLPNLGLNDEANRRISLIDVIWIKQNAPVCAFEVETTTSIYSGILRMSDLITVVPALKVKLYIIAPKERQDKVGSELTRPTFKHVGLNDYCKFIPLEELEELVLRVKDFGGHIQPTIVDKIAISFGEEI